MEYHSAIEWNKPSESGNFVPSERSQIQGCIPSEFLDLLLQESQATDRAGDSPMAARAGVRLEGLIKRERSLLWGDKIYQECRGNTALHISCPKITKLYIKKRGLYCGQTQKRFLKKNGKYMNILLLSWGNKGSNTDPTLSYGISEFCPHSKELSAITSWAQHSHNVGREVPQLHKALGMGVLVPSQGHLPRL